MATPVVPKSWAESIRSAGVGPRRTLTRPAKMFSSKNAQTPR
jgi:hypothetical protein